MLTKWILSTRPKAALVAITVVGVVVSVGLSLVLMWAMNVDDYAQGVLISAVIPAIVAPAMGSVAIRIVTDLEGTRGQLARSEERHRGILEGMADGYFEADEDGVFTFVNPALCQILGRPGAALLGSPAADHFDGIALQAIPPADGEEVRPAEWRVRRGESERIVEALVTPLRGAAGYRGVARDVTEKRSAEQERVLLQDRLLQAQKMEALGTLAGGIAHDFNNILMGISGNAATLSEEVGESGHASPLADIDTLVRSGARLTQQLLGYARKGRYTVRTHDVNEIVRGAAEPFGRARKELGIIVRLHPDPLPVEADLGQLDQVLMNLFVNAADAMPSGGRLEIVTGLAQGEDGEYVSLEISDTGAGIPPEDQQRIFEPFFTTKGMGQGTGLGLASVYGIVKGHGGHIEVHSQVGRGTTFLIHLPRSAGALTETRPPPRNGHPARREILLIDDEPLILRACSRLLTSLGFLVHTAGGGEAGLALFEGRSHDIDLVILDMIMPDMNGLETFQRLKAVDPEVKVLLTSGYSLNEQAEEILGEGCAGFIQKPYSRKVIASKIEEVIPA